MNLVRLEDGLEALIDHRGKTPKKLGSDFVESGVPVASAILVDGGRLRLDEARCVSHDVFEKWMPVKVKMGDVILTSEAPLGKLARVESDAPLVLGQRLYGLRGRKGVLDSGFLYYVLQTDRVKADLVGRSTGTTVTGIRQSALRDVRIPAPDIATQQAIANVLSALDDKIAANTKLATTADELAQLKFNSMLSGGSAEVPLSSCARFVNGKNFTKGATGVGRVVIRIAELNSGIGNSTVRNEIEAGEDNTARPGDLLFAWSGSLTVHRWYFDEGVINQHIFKVIPSGGYPLWLINQLLLKKLGDFKSIAADKATTMGHIQRRHLDESVRIPSIDVIAREHRSMQALWDRALMAERENQTLIATRDTLLPALMSGRLTVRDAEATVESAFDGARVEPEAVASGKLW